MKQVLTYHLPTKFHCHSFKAIEVLREGEDSAWEGKNPKRNRVKAMLCFFGYEL